jgi:hypothetical protein
MARIRGIALTVFVLCLWNGLPSASRAGVATDTDGDGIPDVLDKCMLDSRNAVAPQTCDTDCDGYGNVCDADFDQSLAVGEIDFVMFFIPRFKSGIDSPPVGADMDCSGAVNSSDFSMFFIPRFKGQLGGAIPGPSGLACAGQPGCGC